MLQSIFIGFVAAKRRKIRNNIGISLKVTATDLTKPLQSAQEFPLNAIASMCKGVRFSNYRLH